MRSAGLTIDDLGDEVLVYDHESDVAHCLSREAAAVWRACDGKRTVEAVERLAATDRETAERALTELSEKRLLLDRGLAVEVQQAGEGISRRQALGRLAGAAAAPLVVSVAAPTAWASHSVRARTTCPSSGPSEKVCPAGTRGCKQCANSPCVPTDTACEFNKTGADAFQNHCCPTGWRCTGTAGNLTCTHV